MQWQIIWCDLKKGRLCDFTALYNIFSHDLALAKPIAQTGQETQAQLRIGKQLVCTIIENCAKFFCFFIACEPNLLTLTELCRRLRFIANTITSPSINMLHYASKDSWFCTTTIGILYNPRDLRRSISHSH